MLDDEIQSVISFCHTDSCGGLFYSKGRLPRYSNVDSTGSLCLEVHIIIIDDAKHVK